MYNIIRNRSIVSENLETDIRPVYVNQMLTFTIRQDNNFTYFM